MKDPHNIPVVILIGGQSKRMGRDKFDLDYGAGAHWKDLVERLGEVFDTIYLSANKAQAERIDYKYLIVDRFESKGPMGGILSAFEELNSPQTVLILGCDLPFITAKSLMKLVEQNDPKNLATCATKAGCNFPEPTVAVWNELAIDRLRSHVERNELSLQKLLKPRPHALVEMEDTRELFNANTLSEYGLALKKLAP